jgi:hypothetical protein
MSGCNKFAATEFEPPKVFPRGLRPSFGPNMITKARNLLVGVSIHLSPYWGLSPLFIEYGYIHSFVRICPKPARAYSSIFSYL